MDGTSDDIDAIAAFRAAYAEAPYPYPYPYPYS